MWSGVIVMTRTITTWTVTRATIATGTFGLARTLASVAGVGRFGPVSSWRDDRSASAYGSGRSAMSVRSAAAPTNTTGTRYAPDTGARPRLIAKDAAGAARFGPITAPTVAPQTTMPIADARRADG